MKATLFWTTATLLGFSFGTHFAVPPGAASESILLAQSEDTVELEPSEEYSADALSVEPIGIGLGSEVDAETWETVASQINQGINNDEEEEFLPEGVVVRGSGNSLQLGGELP